MMQVSGHVQNGVVVLDGAVSLPEGASVVVMYQESPVIRVAETRIPVVLPIFDADETATIDLTNERIAEILDQEDASS